MSRLSIELTDTQHQQIKALAAIKGQSIKQYVVDRILPSGSINADELAAIEELKTVMTQRVLRTHSEGASNRTIHEITSDILAKK